MTKPLHTLLSGKNHPHFGFQDMNSFFSNRALRPRLMLFVVASIVLHVWHSAGAVESTSKLAGIALPTGASRIVDAKTVKESVEPLRTIAANLETPVQLQATEVLAWGGTGYKRESGTKIITTVQAALQAAGFQTIKIGEPQNAQGSIISFFLTGATQKKKALLGYWLESDTLLMLVWGQVASRAVATNPLDIKQGGTVPQNAGKSAPQPPRRERSQRQQRPSRSRGHNSRASLPSRIR
jgi:hypothetical protein